jgi:hypothetical protein
VREKEFGPRTFFSLTKWTVFGLSPLLIKKIIIAGEVLKLEAHAQYYGPLSIGYLYHATHAVTLGLGYSILIRNHPNPGA